MLFQALLIETTYQELNVAASSNATVKKKCIVQSFGFVLEIQIYRVMLRRGKKKCVPVTL